MGVTAAMSLAVVAHRKSHAYRKDGDVMRGLDFLGDLVKGELAEGVNAGGYQNDVLAPSIWSTRSSVSYRASNRLVSANPGIRNWFSAP